LAVLCLDLDRFKDINDVFGHAVGDQMLQVFANRVTALLESGQTMARLSGDEFAIILPHLSSPATAGRIAENILQELRTAMTTADADSLLATSIGIAVCPDDATDRQTLLSHADTALYRAKNEGRGVLRFFEASMGAAVRDRRLLEHDLRRAIPQGELSLVYQPQKDIRTGNVIGFEALLRWKHPIRGEILPNDFIPMAEETGLIFQVGEWVLRSACREAATWQQPLTVAVNVSGRQIHSDIFAATLHDILFETKLSPQQLELEITESTLIRDMARALSTLRLVKALGVRIAMDDFGTGYSSLSNLMAFPFDKIKIDSSFIRSVNDNDQAATIVRAVLGLGRGLRLPVLAEGVETHAELQFLQRELCDEAQGYFLGRPSDIESFRYLTHGSAASGTASATVTPFMPRPRPE
jgi:diguanylate cyclase (GGDEF)-like protein